MLMSIAFTKLQCWESQLFSCFYAHSPLLLAFYVPQDQYGATPLYTACFDNHPQVASYLISEGARVNYQQKVIQYLYYFID